MVLTNQQGYKVTSLAVRVSRPNQSHAAYPSKMSLRQAALWYPNIPPNKLLLNEKSFAGQGPLSANYRPLCWIHFGGPGGKSLDYVQGNLVQFSHGLHGLQFVYDEAYGRRHSDKLGRCKEQESQFKPLFPIDGVKGERIDSVHVGMSSRKISARNG